MTQRSLGILRVTRLVSGLALRRLVNRFGGLSRKKQPDGTRKATPRKSAAGKAILAVLAVLFVLQVTFTTTQFVYRAARGVEQREAPNVLLVDSLTFGEIADAERKGACEQKPIDPEVARSLDESFQLEALHLRDDALRERRVAEFHEHFAKHCAAGFRESRLPSLVMRPSADAWLRSSDPLGMAKPLLLAAVLLSIAVMFQNVGGTGRDLADVDARFEWLFSFPVRARSLFLSRILAMAFTTPSAWVMLCPFYATIFACAGFGWFAVLLGVVVTFYFGLLSGSLRTLLETGLPRFLSPPNVSRVQAFFLLSGYIAMVSAFGVIFSPSVSWFLERSSSLADAWLFTPLSAPLALTGGSREATIGSLVVAGSALLVPLSTILTCEYLVRDGIVTGSGTHQGARGSSTRAPARDGLFRGMVKKELLALVRDRQLRTQAFVVPVVLAAFQIWMNPSMLESLGANPRLLATAAFGTSVLPLLTGAFAGLAMESPALSLLYTAPVSLERLFAQKIRVWVGVGWLFAGIVFVGIWVRTPALFLPSLPYVPLVFAGTAVYAVIALGVGALGTDPLELEPRRRQRVSSTYLFMILATFYGYTIYSPSLWAKLVQVALSTLLAFALWQKLRDHLPYALDPTEAPPPSIAIADGLLAALGFFVLQGIGLAVFGVDDASMARYLLVAFVWAGGLTTLTSVWWFHRSRLPDLARALGLRVPIGTSLGGRVRALGVGIVAGLATAALALAYQTLVARIPGVEKLLEESSHLSRALESGDRLFFLALAVVAAPLFEEFIFRGILYTGLRRSLRPTSAALASATVFALVHPAISTLPVFAMAFVAAKAYEKFRWLGAPVAAHMTYNGVLTGVALWATH